MPKLQPYQEMLRRMKLDQIRQATPAAWAASGGYDMIIKNYSDRTANGLTRCIIDFLTFSGHYANRISTQGQARVKNIDRYSIFTRKVETVGQKVTWTKGSTRRGTPDIDAIINKRPVKIEVKIGADSMSGEQLSLKLKIESAGGLYLVATSFPQFYEWYCKTFQNLSELDKTRLIN